MAWQENIGKSGNFWENWQTEREKKIFIEDQMEKYTASEQSDKNLKS